MDAVERIKESIDKETIQELLINSGARCLSDNGDSFRCCCPIHEGSDNPTSFVFNYENGLWYCFTGEDCGGGDIFDFIRKYNHLPDSYSWIDIVKLTANTLGIDIEGYEITNRTENWLQDTKRWLNYMRSKHTNQNTEFDIRKLGRLFHMKSYRHFTKETLDHFNAYYSETFNRLAIPIYDENNICIGVTMRRLNNNNNEPKWLHMPKHINMRYILYNYNNVDSNEVYVVEGPFDVWNLYQLGVKNVVATMGSHITKEQETLLIKKFTDIILMFDNDRAGHKATNKAIQRLQYKTNLYVAPLDSFNDPGEVTQEYINNLKPIFSCNYLNKNI